ncbi:HAD-IB family hydrolase [Haloferula sp. BvORR071]|uniref:HAD family hydrolase n=1 Tax=Haloferula sp. BvORR071 TaxID=1396141 RepID=UPI000552FFA1|nr:HAD-IB family hydrolase [Haloferula sp. BvORR071]
MTDELRAKSDRGLALFDLDGTLIAWDTQMLFCDHVLKREGWRRAYLLFFAAFLPAAKVLGDEGMKRVFLSYLWGTDRPQLEIWVRDFVAEFFPARCYPEMLEKLQAHRDAGHLTVLASASPEFYVQEVGRVLGFDLAFGTPVEFERRVPLLPGLVNHKSGEKVRRLSEIMKRSADGLWPRSHGYSDSSADLPMLECCVENTLVNPSSSLTRIGEARGWEIARPAKPWKNRQGQAWEILRRISGLG